MKKETATESVILTAEELDFIKKGAAEFTKIKTSLGELELQKQGLLKKAEEHTMRRFLLRSMVLMQLSICKQER
jgi:hypothetical protein